MRDNAPYPDLGRLMDTLDQRLNNAATVKNWTIARGLYFYNPAQRPSHRMSPNLIANQCYIFAPAGEPGT